MGPTTWQSVFKLLIHVESASTGRANENVAHIGDYCHVVGLLAMTVSRKVPFRVLTTSTGSTPGQRLADLRRNSQRNDTTKHF